MSFLTDTQTSLPEVQLFSNHMTCCIHYSHIFCKDFIRQSMSVCNLWRNRNDSVSTLGKHKENREISKRILQLFFSPSYSSYGLGSSERGRGRRNCGTCNSACLQWCKLHVLYCIVPSNPMLQSRCRIYIEEQPSGVNCHRKIVKILKT